LDAQTTTEHVELPSDPQFYRRVLDHLPSPVIVVDELGHVVYGNRAMVRVGGWSLEEGVGRNMLEMIHPDDADWAAQVFVDLLGADDAQHLSPTPDWLAITLRMIAKDGSIIPIEVTGSGGLHDPVVGGVIYDVRPVRRETVVNSVLTGLAGGAPVRSLLSDAVEFAALPPIDFGVALVEHRPIGAERLIAATDDRVALAVRDAGESWPDVGDRPVRHRLAELRPPWSTDLVDAGFVDGYFAEVEAPDDAIVYRLVGCTPTDQGNAHGPIHRMERARELIMVALLRAHHDRFLDHAASHDVLTDLPNRLELARTFEAYTMAGQPCVLLFIDLDNFKPINDTYGHAGGDRVMSIVADRLRSSVRPSDLVARVGGDEFAVLAPAADDTDAHFDTMADRILRRVSEPISLDGSLIELTASVGIAVSPGETSLESLLAAGDEAMYVAKRAGGGKHHLVHTDTDR